MSSLQRAPELSLIRGGLIYRLERRLGMIDDERWHLRRRVSVFWCLTWLPIVLLELVRVSGIGAEHSIVALYHDLRMNVRFLFCAPILILAETVIDRRLRRSVSQFEERALIGDSAAEQSRFRAAVTQANRQISGTWGVVAEAAILLLCVSAGLAGFWRQTMGPLHDLALYGAEEGGTPALHWYSWVALPLFEFLQLRWIWRYIVWTEFLFKIGRLKLRLIVTHPDELGGLGIIPFAQEGFAVLWLAMSGGAASTVAFRVLNDGVPLQVFYYPMGAFVGIEVLLLLVPLLLFTPHLVIARREGLLDYGKLSSQYVRMFDQKWVVHSGGKNEEPLLGTSDIQSLADLGNSFERVKKMRVFPADKRALIWFVLTGALPFVPLIFLVARVEDIVRAAIRMFF